MRWIVKAELMQEDGTAESVELLSIERCAPETADEVGLRLEETKNIVARLQKVVVDEQLRLFVESRRTCPGCSVRRGVKDYRSRRLGTAHGVVLIRTPRFNPCRCPGACLDSPVLELLPGRITPELRHLQVKLTTKLPYRQAADLLNTFLPRTSGLNHATTRRRTLAVAERSIENCATRSRPEKQARRCSRPSEWLSVSTERS